MMHLANWEDLLWAVGRPVSKRLRARIGLGDGWELGVEMDGSFYWTECRRGVTVMAEWSELTDGLVCEAVFLYGSAEGNRAAFSERLMEGLKFGMCVPEVLGAWPAAVCDADQTRAGEPARWVKIPLGTSEAHCDLTDGRVSMVCLQRAASIGAQERRQQEVAMVLDAMGDIDEEAVAQHGLQRTIERIDRMCGHLLGSATSSVAAVAMFDLIERLDCLPFDDCGNLLSTLEAVDDVLAPLLLESLRRKPTLAAIMLAKRRLHDDLSDRHVLIAVLRWAKAHAKLTERAREAVVRVLSEFES